MRVLLTNNTLRHRAGSELYVLDIATALQERGHQPVAFSTVLGQVADELRDAAIPVVDDLELLAEPPDIIHGQHHVETMMALLEFPGVPAVYFRHGATPWEEHVPRFPRILRYVATGPRAREVLAEGSGIPLDRIEVIPNFVDLRRFRPRGPLPARPERALVFSNQASESTHLSAVREACARAGVALDVAGLASGNPIARPHECLPGYDLVFGIGRAALEAMAVGTAVILCDAGGLGPLVTSAQLDDLRSANFGVRTLTGPLLTEAVREQVRRYDASDAAAVSRRIRATAGLDEAADRIIDLYEQVVAECRGTRRRPSAAAEDRATAAYLRWLSPYLKEHSLLLHERDSLRCRVEGLRAQLEERTAWALRAAGEVAQRDATIVELQAASRKEAQHALERRGEHLRSAAERLAEAVAQRDACVRDLQTQLEAQSAWAQRTAEEVAKRDATILELQAQLERIRNSLPARLYRRVRRVATLGAR